ncbi:MAG: hypothetical protein M3Q31_04370 [Actinomycetota bacterium]|nr:hypothetical protein [Actinomycetota bacterium]
MSRPDVLEIYDSAGALVRIIIMTRDDVDATKWHLADSISLGGPHAETAVIRFKDGTSEPLTPSMFAAAPRSTPSSCERDPA